MLSSFYRMHKEVMGSFLVILVLLAVPLPIAADGRRSYPNGDEHLIYHVDSFGAVGDGIIDDSNAFLKAWDHACNGNGFPTIHIPSGKTLLLGPITLKGPCICPAITIQVDGKIVAPDKKWNADDKEHWLTFKDVIGLTLNGQGHIDGRGSIWWPCVESNKCNGAPNSIRFVRCNNLELRGLKFLNSPSKHISISQTTGAMISGLTITAPSTSPNTDGIHFEDCLNTEISDSSIGTGDDCISIGKNNSFIRIHQIQCGPGHGISIGSLGKDNTEDVVEWINVTSCKFSQTQNGARIKTWQGGRGYVRNIYFEKLQFHSVEKPIVVDQYYCNGKHNCGNKTAAVQVSKVQFDGLRGSSTKEAIYLACSKTVPCTGIRLHNVIIESANPSVPAKSYCINAHGSFTGLVRPQVLCLGQQ